MGRIFKFLGSKESARELWENREALDKYLARLKELMEEDNSKPDANHKDSEPPEKLK